MPAAARVTNQDNNGNVIQTGSHNVFINEGSSGSSVITSNMAPEPRVMLTVSQRQTYANNVANQEKYNTSDNIENGVDGHPEMEDDPNKPPEIVIPSTVNPNCAGSTGDMGATLDQVLAESAAGKWKENGNNPNINALYKNVGFDGIAGDKTAWCAAFAGSMLKKNCFKYNKSLAAGSYTNYGHPINISQAQKGDIVIFNRDGGTGHVAFFHSFSDTPGYIWVVGGNQSNSVTKSLRKISDLKTNGVQRPTPV